MNYVSYEIRKAESQDVRESGSQEVMKHGSQGGHGVTGWLSRIGSRKVIL